MTLLRRIESRTTHVERTGRPRINVAVNLVHRASSYVEHRLGAPFALRLPAPGQETGGRRASRLMWPPTADARVQRPAAARPWPSFTGARAPVVLSPAFADAGRGHGEPRGLINAPETRTIALSGAAPSTAHPRLGVAEVRSADGDSRTMGMTAGVAMPGSVDIDRLTDKVVATMDRRLWSHRERMGGR